MAGTPEFGKALDSNFRFGPFELDVRAAELRKNGLRIRLQAQPFQILLILLERHGEVVLRDEIQSRLWPGNTVVEFDHSINAAIRRLRDALQDSAEKPRYIETVARRGYRFIGEIYSPGQPAPAAEPRAIVPGNGSFDTAAASAPANRLPHWNGPRIFILIAVVALPAGVWTGAEYRKRTSWRSQPTLRPLMRLDLDLGNNVSRESHRGADAVLSPDGMRLVYVSQSKLFLRRLDQASAVELPGTENAEGPFVSPDGQWVAFFAGGKLKKVLLRGGPVIPLCDAPGVGGGSWGEDGNLVATLNFTLSRIPAGGGYPVPLTELDPGEIVHRWPQILPGGKAILFTAYPSLTGVEGATIQVLSLTDRRRKTLVRGTAWGRYLASGHLIYIDKGTLLAVPFDLDRLEVRGAPTSVLQEVAYSTAWGYPQLDLSRTGALVYRSSRNGNGLVTVHARDETGETSPLLPVPGNYSFPTLSPDGKRLLLISGGDIWIYELLHGTMTRLTFGGGYGFPVWTNDGRYVVFRGARGMLWTRTDGTGQPEVLTQSSWTPAWGRQRKMKIDTRPGRR